MKKQFLYISLIACQAMVAMDQSKRQFAVPADYSPEIPVDSTACTQRPTRILLGITHEIRAQGTLQARYSLDQALAEEPRKQAQVIAVQLTAKLAPVAAAQESEQK